MEGGRGKETKGKEGREAGRGRRNRKQGEKGGKGGRGKEEGKRQGGEDDGRGHELQGRRWGGGAES